MRSRTNEIISDPDEPTDSTEDNSSREAAEQLPAEPFNIEQLFKVTYIAANTTQWTMLYFREAKPLGEVVKIARNFCEKKNHRFIYVEPAVHILE